MSLKKYCWEYLEKRVLSPAVLRGTLAFYSTCVLDRKERLMLATSIQTPVAPMTRLYWDSVPSPMGDCVIMANEIGICWLGTPGTSLEAGLAWAKYALRA